MSRNTATVSFQALELKGSLLPASLLEEVSKLNRPKELLLEGHDYGLSRGERLRDRIDAAWVLTKELWEEYGNLRERVGQSTAGLHFGLRLLKEVFGWSGVEPCHGWQHGESRYPITHRAFGGAVPLILRGLDAGDLDRGSKQFGQDERKRSPHSCLQYCLNADDSANWGVLLSGDRFRLLHDNPSLVKPAYLAADLELLIEGERFDEFSVLWLLLHASRFQHPKTGNCVLDDWKQKAEESGERVLGALRGGVQSALESLGWGFLNHPANGGLREALQLGQLSRQQFHEQLLRLVYRFLFLFTAEDRDLLFPRELKADDPRRRIYREGYSVSRLRELAIKRSAYEGDYGDLWELQRLVFQQLSIGDSPLGLPGLGGLFSLEQCPDLQAAELWNGPLLRAIKAIGWFDAGGSFTRVRYRDLNTEELGSVYEGLLELHPQLEQQGSQWQLSYGGGEGSDRKTTGSYYTPDALVQELIKSALIPVIDDRLSKAHGQPEQEQALLNIKVIDPACGSGHFLLAAARRLAVALAQVRAGDDQPSEDDRQHALRDVVAHCIYAVDRNPMAVQLCKVALWIEAIDPGKPLSFLDAHIQCGDSLVGVFDPKVLEEGIPDEAYKPLTGDNKTVCTSLKKENAAARKTISRGGSNRGIQGSLDLSGTQPRSQGQHALQAIEAMPETTLAETAAKQAAYAQWLADRGRDPETLAADLYTASFFLAKTSDSRATVPTTEHLLKLLAGQAVEEVMEEAVVQAAQNFRFFHWHLRFGEVMERGGFDCVLGNPPWGSELDYRIKNYLKAFQSFVDSSTPNAFAYFCGLTLVLQKISGRCGMVVPDSILFKDYSQLRSKLSALVSRILWFQNSGAPSKLRQFPGVDHDFCILAWSGSPSLSADVIVSQIGPDGSLVVTERQLLKSFFIKKEYDFIYNISMTDSAQQIAIHVASLPTLSDRFSCNEGIHTGNCRDLLFHEACVNDHCKPLFYGAGGGDKINNYYSQRAGWWVDYRKEIIDKSEGLYASLRDESIFTGAKIYVTRTGNPFKAFYDNCSYASNNFFSIKTTRSGSDGEDILLLGTLPFIISPFAQYFIRRIAAPRIGQAFIETKITHLMKLPIPQLSSQQVETLAELVRQAIHAKSKGMEESANELEMELQTRVLSAYQFNEKMLAEILQ